jgi:hypothetical protein
LEVERIKMRDPEELRERAADEIRGIFAALRETEEGVASVDPTLGDGVEKVVRAAAPVIEQIRPSHIGPIVNLRWCSREWMIEPDSNRDRYLEPIIVQMRVGEGWGRFGELDEKMIADAQDWLPDDIWADDVFEVFAKLYAAINRLLAAVEDEWIEEVNRAFSSTWGR